MDPLPTAKIGHDLGNQQLHNEKLVIKGLFTAVAGSKDHGHDMLEKLAPCLVSIMIRPIDIDRIITLPQPDNSSYSHVSHPSVQTHSSKMSASTLCHSSVREVVVPPFTGQESNLSSCPKTATYIDVSKKSTISDGVSVTTNSYDESVPTSSSTAPYIRGIYSSSQGSSDESHVVKSAAEGCEFELDRESNDLSDRSQGSSKRQRVANEPQYFENDVLAIEKYLVSEGKDKDPFSSLLFQLIMVSNYAGGFIGSHSKKTSSSPFFGVEVFTIMSPI